MNLWKDRRVDSLHRVVLPREAFSLLGWTSDEVLEAEALPAQDALLLRAQNHPRPQDVYKRQGKDAGGRALHRGPGGHLFSAPKRDKGAGPRHSESAPLHAG